MPNIRYSEEIQDIIGTIPNRFLRWGQAIILIVFIGIIAACYFIKHPEVVPVPIELTSFNPPVNLKAPQSKRIDKLFFSDGDSVRENSVILLLESVADYNDIRSIETLVINNDKTWEEIIANDSIYRDYALGDIQSVFVQFRKQCADFSNFLGMSLLPQKRELLESRIDKQNNILRKQKEQYILLRNELKLRSKGYQRDSIIFKANGITLADLERSEQVLLQKESEVLGFAATISNTENTILSLKEQLIENRIQENTQREQFHAQLNESRQQLSAEFEKWKKNYLIVSPIAGKLSLSKYWSANQNVTYDEVVASVIPLRNLNMVGKGVVSYAWYTRVKIGQKVNVKLDNYPYMRYGIVTGSVSNISLVPQGDGYTVDIHFPQGLITNYGLKLDYAHQMKGTADIITDDIRLIEQFLFPIKDLIHRIEK